ncbi:hypothetical protein PROFUN_12190 [Planoprotostelium fungivorum]|uniref:Vps72/YL1 C-terminal domain-containing protein n=1 Tax=Planoprotostelium fungivorum TaxID=1890364 RepID=A0A2P6N8J0_9EUKA|nr:hypothetical protein PROFUN_12190 [Planoprotostelium fungivorum]
MSRDPTAASSGEDRQDTMAKGDKAEKAEKNPSSQKSLTLPFKKKGWKNNNCQARGNQRYWMHLKQIIQAENYSRFPVDTPTYTSIAASISLMPPKKYCDITGYVAPYTCPKSKLRYCTSEVYQFIHRQLNDEDRNKYLSLRQAQPKIK